MCFNPFNLVLIGIFYKIHSVESVMSCYAFIARTFVSYDFLLFNIERDCIEFFVVMCLLF